MLTGIRVKAIPTSAQRLTLGQWMGCARVIWNAKCEEYRYYSTYARKYCPLGTFAPVDAQYSQFKDKEISPWLFGCPSQILRNSATNWFWTFQAFMKGQCGKPKRKKKSGNGSIYLTRELFRFELGNDGKWKLFVGTKTNNIGYLPLSIHRDFKVPASIYVKRRHDEFWAYF